MSSKRESDEHTSKSYEKLARLYYGIANLQSGLNELLEAEGHINYQVPESSCLKLHQPNDVGNTALHFTIEIPYLSAVELLIGRGADFTVKNRKGLTAIHLLVRLVHDYSWFKNQDPFMLQERLIETTASSSPLTAHVEHRNAKNPRDPHGISHFHAACLVNHAEAVEFFLNNQVPVDEAVDSDSPMFPGYTPLHFAVRYVCLEVANALLSRGPNLFLNDANGMTALHLAIERNMSVVRCMNLRRFDAMQGGLRREIKGDRESFLAKIANSERVLFSILSKIDETMIDSLGLSAFYAMHALENALSMESYIQSNINKPIDGNSALWPGYTALHFAARFGLETFKLLLKNNADIEAKDANGDTPFDLCVGAYDVKDILDIVSSHIKWRQLLLSDGETKLVDLLRAMQNPGDFVRFVDELKLDINNISIPTDSPLWPGLTILHLAVILSKRCIDIEETYYSLIFHTHAHEIKPNKVVGACLGLGADVTCQDVHGSTPLHLAFRRFDVDNMHLLLQNHKGNVNPVDKDNVSHLHIACMMGNEDVVKKCIDCGVDVDGAVSPTFRWEPEVQQDLQIGKEKQYFKICEGSTPLHVAIESSRKVIAMALMEAGANVDAKNVNCLTPLHLLFRNSHLKYSIGEILLSPAVTKDNVVNGLSYLHVAAYGDCPEAEEAVEKLLRLGADINSAIVNDGKMKQIDSDEELSEYKANWFFPIKHLEGNTPLHSCVANQGSYIPRTLITRGADVFAKNSLGGSPILGILARDYLLDHYVSVMNENDEKRLVDEMGITRLHMACKIGDEKTIQRCVKEGANVNARVRGDSMIWPGYTPLHVFVASYHDVVKKWRGRGEHEKEMCRIARFFLKNGVDVTIADVNGDTPLLLNIYENHVSSNRPDHIYILMESLKNTVVNPVNLRGISHFHLACIKNDVALVESFLKLGADVNQTVDYFSNVYPGYTPLHFATCRDFIWFRNDLPPLRTINLLLKFGADVHAREAMLGNTPLHVAAQCSTMFELPYKRILWAGADPEVKNYDDATPPSYLYKITREDIRNVADVCQYICLYSYRKLSLAIRAYLNRRENTNK